MVVAMIESVSEHVPTTFPWSDVGPLLASLFQHDTGCANRRGIVLPADWLARFAELYPAHQHDPAMRSVVTLAYHSLTNYLTDSGLISSSMK